MKEDLSFSQFYEDVNDAWFIISETCVDVSKCHITAEDGIRKIRGLLKPLDRYLKSTSSFATSAQPERKGKWIRIKASCYQCNLCGVVVTSGFSNFCHRCGADMRQEDTE